MNPMNRAVTVRLAQVLSLPYPVRGLCCKSEVTVTVMTTAAALAWVSFTGSSHFSHLMNFLAIVLRINTHLSVKSAAL